MATLPPPKTSPFSCAGRSSSSSTVNEVAIKADPGCERTVLNNTCE